MISQISLCLGLISIALAAPAAIPLKSNTDAVPNITDWIENGLFEGDLKLSKEFILDHYNFSSVPGGEKLRDLLVRADDGSNSSRRIERRGAGKEGRIKLWTDNIVRYRISNGISQSTVALIRRAIDHFEDNTCLRFVTANSGDYIDFINTDTGCYSTDIGRRGGRQVINLQPNINNYGCEHFGIIVHEIGHAIGFWHEQTRPDRDQYVTIHFDNIEDKPDSKYQFMRQNDIHSFGSIYDYGSIMHYGETYLKKLGCSESGCTTISVNNQAEYNRQGRPVVGQRTELSTEDINQVNLLYACFITNLQVYIGHARNLRDTDPWLNDPDPYVKVQARRAIYSDVTKSTRYIGGTTNPNWNQWLNFGCQRWRNFDMQVWDDDNFLTFGDDEMSNKELVLMSPGNHYSLRHSAHDRGYLIYHYKLIKDTNDCIPNRCQNGGRCIDQCTSYRCSCPRGYAGNNCEYSSGNLVVYARYGRNLPDKDGWWNDSDPYMEFIAVDRFGRTQRLTTSAKSGTHNPDWYQSLNFGRRAWSYFRVRVYDEDNNDDDALSNSMTYYLHSPNYSRSYVSHTCYSGNAVFDFSYSN